MFNRRRCSNKLSRFDNDPFDCELSDDNSVLKNIDNVEETEIYKILNSSDDSNEILKKYKLDKLLEKFEIVNNSNNNNHRINKYKNTNYIFVLLFITIIICILLLSKY